MRFCTLPIRPHAPSPPQAYGGHDSVFSNNVVAVRTYDGQACLNEGDYVPGHESAQFGALNDFLTALTTAREDNDTLLDRTMVLYGTCMGSASSHSNVNLPALLAGGGFKHGQHLAFDNNNNYPLTNLYVSILQRLGIETNEFSTAKATMKGLEMS
jgi:hypothetical protein